MANRQNYPASLFPLRGDVSAEAGDTTVTVEGIQTQPVDPAVPETGNLLVYGADGVWHPEDPVVSGTDEVGTVPTKAPVQVAGVDNSNRVRELLTDTAGGLRLLETNDLLIIAIGELRAIKLAIVSLDSTAQINDYAGTKFLANDPSES